MHISAHALARYMERVGAHDVDTAREELTAAALRATPYQQDGEYTHELAQTASGSMTVVRVGEIVVTVY